MGLFGKKKDPSLLVQEGKRLTDLVLDWLREPLGQMQAASQGDRVMTEHYLLVLCSYIAREKISRDAKEYFHHALTQTSPYCKNYAKDQQKEANLLAVMLASLEAAEREARRKRTNVLEAMVAVLFRDFSVYRDPVLVKRVVYATVNQFNEEIPTTDYAGLRLPVSAAPAPSRPAPAPAKPAPAPAPSRPAPAPARPGPAPAPANPAPVRHSDYIGYDRNQNPVYFNKLGGAIVHSSRAYQPVVNQDNRDEVVFLDITDRNYSWVQDQALLRVLTGAFLEKNPNYLFTSELPTYFDLRNQTTGQSRRANLVGWLDHWGKTYAVTRWADGNGGIVVLEWQPDNTYVGLDAAEATKILNLFRAKNPQMFR